jgi:hypothetical protein
VLAVLGENGEAPEVNAVAFRLVKDAAGGNIPNGSENENAFLHLLAESFRGFMEYPGGWVEPAAVFIKCGVQDGCQQRGIVCTGRV